MLPFPTLAERYTWMIAIILSLILPPLSVYSGILQLRAIRERAHLFPLSLWLSTITEAKQFLDTFASTYQGNMLSNLVGKRIKVGQAVHIMSSSRWPQSFYFRLLLRERVLQKNSYLPAKTTLLLEWRIRG